MGVSIIVVLYGYKSYTVLKRYWQTGNSLSVQHHLKGVNCIVTKVLTDAIFYSQSRRWSKIWIICIQESS